MWLGPTTSAPQRFPQPAFPVRMAKAAEGGCWGCLLPKGRNIIFEVKKVKRQASYDPSHLHPATLWAATKVSLWDFEGVSNTEKATQ